MEERIAPRGGAEGYPLEEYDRIWQRVAPELEPYPQLRRGAAEQRETGGAFALPGAQADPCCMGSLARESIDVLRGFMEEENESRLFYLHALSCVRNERTAQLLRRLAETEGEHLRQLQAAYYLITGERIAMGTRSSVQPCLSCRALLRAAYHHESCAAFNYLRAADGAEDPCLQQLLRRIGEEEQQHARMLLEHLAKTMR